MGLFPSKKKSDASLKTLNEKEIQQKLYGHYYLPKTTVGGGDYEFLDSHTNVSSAPKSPAPQATTSQVSQTQVAEKTSPTLFPDTASKATSSTSGWAPVKPAKKNDSSAHSSGHTHSPSAEGNQSTFSQIDWRVIAGVSLGVFVLVGLLYGVVQLKHKREVSQEFLPETPKSVSVSRVASQNDKKEVFPIAPKPSKVSDSEVQHIEGEGSKALETSRLPKGEVSTSFSAEKYYSIQICTYRNIEDAERLTNRLLDLKLPAHYVTLPGKLSDKGKFFLVLVGKDANYSEAQARLSKFKQLPIWNEFPDSYIRRNA